MKPRFLRKGGGYILLCTVMILGALLLIGCGSDGDTGPAGPTGPPGPGAPIEPGEPDIPATSETCALCHGAGKIADVAVAHPDDPAYTGAEVIISNITLTNTAGLNDGLPVVSFHLEKRDGTAVTTIAGNPVNVDNFRFYMATLVPAGTATQWGTWDTPYWERWVQERAASSNTVYPQGTLVDNGGGNYTYTFATAFGSPTALVDAPDYNVSQVQRLWMQFDGRLDPKITQRAIGFLDFNIPAKGAQAAALDPQRQFVTAEACEKCHSPNWERAAHAGGYRDIRTCVMCHSPLGVSGTDMQEHDAHASVFFHKIHAAKDIPFWREDERVGDGYTGVTFPQEVRDCVICHVDNGKLGTQAFQIDQWKNHQTGQICGSCHDNVDFITGTNHGGGAQPDNDGCKYCHPSSGPSTIAASVTVAHDITPRVLLTNGAKDKGFKPQNIPEFEVNFSITAPANGTFYVAGETPEVRVTLADPDGQPVSPALYTTPQDAAGNPGDGLRVASLYVYGPRAKALPVLITGSPDAQSANLFVLGTDPQVTTDSTGFGYKLLPIPADLKKGTYLVRVRFGDYGYISDTNYIIESTYFRTIQIGDAKETAKVAGDACFKCHGTGTAPFHDARHSVVFDTDECLACHQDRTPGERTGGTPLANRVHAVHSANPEGDIYNVLNSGTISSSRDWSEITYPRDIANCNSCHDSGYVPASNTFTGTYKTLPYMMPCAGCHVGESADPDMPFVPGVYDHMVQNGGPW
jgi:hypothetical protein